eukprot:1196190-Prorocentrum_minimum.AAC.6
MPGVPRHRRVLKSIRRANGRLGRQGNYGQVPLDIHKGQSRLPAIALATKSPVSTPDGLQQRR